MVFPSCKQPCIGDFPASHSNVWLPVLLAICLDMFWRRIYWQFVSKESSELGSLDIVPDGSSTCIYHCWLLFAFSLLLYMFMQTDLVPSHKSGVRDGGGVGWGSNVHVHVHTLLTSHRPRFLHCLTPYTLHACTLCHGKGMGGNDTLHNTGSML